MAEEKGADHTYTNEWGTWSWNDEVAPTTDEYKAQIDTLTDLPTEALAFVTSLANLGEWTVPGAGKQTAGDWISYFGTEQGRGWAWAQTPEAWSSYDPSYGEEYEVMTKGGIVTETAGRGGAAQFGATRENPVLALPWIKGSPSERPSAEHQYGRYPGGGFAPSGRKKQQTSFLGGDKSVYREGLGEAPSRVAPPARWLLF